MKTWQTLGYWFPSNRKGAIFNDTVTIPANAQNPVLAHHFLDWMMTYKNAMLNYTWNGYQPPQRKADPATLTTTNSYYGEPYVFPWLSDAVVHESDFRTGYFEEELTPPGRPALAQRVASVQQCLTRRPSASPPGEGPATQAVAR
jgi:Spermidine/putrescine-binding periplasmic protein